MSIKFPDFQILVARSDQVPKVNREGDPTGAAGRLAPQVSEEFADRERRVVLNREKERIRDRKEDRRRRHDRDGSGRPRGGRRRIDLRA
ncbi:MAG: hypothetical protein ACOX46_05835 [Limnochordia bacterium]|jgi:hypothetical protein|nr:hypothetical protein [Bacillota bacterium]NLL08542.1 hypothetical protein [Bacillota bacterium]HBG08644.1 hypothetical protein [Bacillota bacterium]